MTTLQAGIGEIMVWGMLSRSTQSPLISMATPLNNAAYLNIVAGKLHPFTAVMFLYGVGYFE